VSSQDDKLIPGESKGEHNARMTNESTNAMRNVDQKQNQPAPSLAAEFADLRRALRGLMDPYRPERHYMRGPGPKWHAKHRPALSAPDSLGVLQQS
jgi:hypothetical protein